MAQSAEVGRHGLTIRATDGKPTLLTLHHMITVPLLFKRQERGMFIQKLQHAVPSIVVLGDGIEHLSHDPHGVDLALGVAEVAVSVLVIGVVIRGFRQLRARPVSDDPHARHHGVDWIDICLGAMLSVEAYAKFHATGHVPRPTILLAIVMIAIGLLHGKVKTFGDRRREMRVSPDGLSVPGRRPFQRLTLTWPEVQSIDMDDRTALVTAIDGRTRRIDLADAVQPQAIRDALLAARTLLEDTRHAASASIESNPSAT